MKRIIISLLIALTLALSTLSSLPCLAEAAPDIELSRSQAAKPAEYLESYFGIAPFGEAFDLSDFNAALEARGQEPAANDTPEAIAMAAVKLAGMDEPAQTYDGEEAYVACAHDLGLIKNPDRLDGESAASLLYDALSIAGKTRRCIGRVSDRDILQKLDAAMSAMTIFADDRLDVLGAQIVLREATTGYSLKYSGYDARFLEDYTLRYGHDDLRHMLQLVALLNGKGIDAWIQVEPKVSVYKYLLDWGEPSDPTPTYAVREVAESRYLCFSMEYDVALEFDSLDDKEDFHGIIETYAKKYDDSFDADGNLIDRLIVGSWWQPLYYSTTELQNKAFEMLYDNIVYDKDGLYYINSFSLPENTRAIEEVVKDVTPELVVSHVPIYVNPAFMRYIRNEDHQ